MRFARTLTSDQFALTLLVVLLALFARAVVPQGYMPAQSAERIFDVRLCGIADADRSAQIRIPMKSGSNGDSADHRASGMECAFTSLAMGALGGADAPLLASNWQHLWAAGFATLAAAPLSGAVRLRPPATGPPVFR